MEPNRKLMKKTKYETDDQEKCEDSPVREGLVWLFVLDTRIM